jgi:hypothetical protein
VCGSSPYPNRDEGCYSQDGEQQRREAYPARQVRSPWLEQLLLVAHVTIRALRTFDVDPRCFRVTERSPAWPLVRSTHLQGGQAEQNFLAVRVGLAAAHLFDLCGSRHGRTPTRPDSGM